MLLQVSARCKRLPAEHHRRAQPAAVIGPILFIRRKIAGDEPTCIHIYILWIGKRPNALMIIKNRRTYGAIPPVLGA